MSSFKVESRASVNFPSLCVLRHYHGKAVDEMNNALARLLLELEKKNRETAKTTYTQGGYHTDPEFINGKDAVVQALKNNIFMAGVQEYLTHFYNVKNVRPRQVTADQLSFRGWGNVIRKGEWNAPHNHTGVNNRISAVYYIKIPECPRPDGSLQFENPNQISVQHGEYGNVIFHPSEGDLVLFPAYQVHFSRPFHVEGDRMLVAADIRVKDEFDFTSINDHISQEIQSGPPASSA